MLLCWLALFWPNAVVFSSKSSISPINWHNYRHWLIIFLKIIELDYTTCIPKTNQSTVACLGTDLPGETHSFDCCWSPMCCGKFMIRLRCKNSFRLRVNSTKHSFEVLTWWRLSSIVSNKALIFRTAFSYLPKLLGAMWYAYHFIPLKLMMQLSNGIYKT